MAAAAADDDEPDWQAAPHVPLNNATEPAALCHQLCGRRSRAAAVTLAVADDAAERLSWALQQLPRLRQLRLLGGRLPGGLRALGGGLLQLQVLSVCGCQLASLDGVAALPSLQQLYAAQNQLTDVAGCSCLDRLQVLDVRDNQLSDATSLMFLAACGELRRLELLGNPVGGDRQQLEQLPRWLPQLLRLNGQLTAAGARTQRRRPVTATQPGGPPPTPHGAAEVQPATAGRQLSAPREAAAATPAHQTVAMRTPPSPAKALPLSVRALPSSGSKSSMCPARDPVSPSKGFFSKAKEPMSPPKGSSLRAEFPLSFTKEAVSPVKPESSRSSPLAYPTGKPSAGINSSTPAACSPNAATLASILKGTAPPPASNSPSSLSKVSAPSVKSPAAGRTPASPVKPLRSQERAVRPATGQPAPVRPGVGRDAGGRSERPPRTSSDPAPGRAGSRPSTASSDDSGCCSLPAVGRRSAARRTAVDSGASGERRQAKGNAWTADQAALARAGDARKYM